jgi:hypothetical protein
MSDPEMKIGDAVVCIRVPKPLYGKRDRWAPKTPQIGEKYTIREIFEENRHPGCGRHFVRLVEIKNRKVATYCGPYEAAFLADLFALVPA